MSLGQPSIAASRRDSASRAERSTPAVSRSRRSAGPRPEYFQVLGIPLRRGRWLTDSEADQNRILINETLARRFFANQNPVGQHLILGVMDPKQNLHEIAGVVGDVRDLGLDQEVEPMFYSISTGPVMTAVGQDGSRSTAVRSRRFAKRFKQSIRKFRFRRSNRSLKMSPTRWLGVVSRSRCSESSVRMAALLTAAGVYGLLAYSVNARVREFGVRGAVGATRWDLVAMILREAAILMAPGLAAGLILALAFSSVMKSFVYRLSPLDPWSLASAAGFLVAADDDFGLDTGATRRGGGPGHCAPRRQLVQYQPCDAENSLPRLPWLAPQLSPIANRKRDRRQARDASSNVLRHSRSIPRCPSKTAAVKRRGWAAWGSIW